MVFWSTMDLSHEQESQTAERNVARNARYAGPANIDSRSGARTHHRACHRARIGECVASRARIVIPRAPPVGGPWLDRVLLGNVREQSQGALLPADNGGTAAARRTNQPMGSDC